MGKDLKGKEIGKGFHQRKDGRYEARTQINGKTIDICNKSLTALRKIFNEEKAKTLRDEYNIRPNETLLSWYNEWFEKCKAPQLKNEICAKKYDAKIKNTYLSILGEKKLEYLSQLDIQQATNELIAKGYVQRTLEEALSAIKQCMDAAIANKIMQHNVCLGVCVKDAKPIAERRVLEHWEQDLFISQIQGTFYYEPYMILMLTGMRIGEFSALRWSDIDFYKKEIYIKRSMSTAYIEGVKYEEVTSPKTISGFRTIPFFSNVDQLFKDWRDKQAICKTKMGKRWRAKEEFGDLLFTTKYGSPLTRYALAHTTQLIVKNMRAIEGYNAQNEGREPRFIDNIYPHAFRHTFATRCFEKKMEPYFVQKIMGHANYSTTLSYTHILESKSNMEKMKGEDLLGFAS